MDVWVVVETTQFWDPDLDEWINTNRVEVVSVHTDEENAKVWATPPQVVIGNTRFLKVIHKSYIVGE